MVKGMVHEQAHGPLSSAKLLGHFVVILSMPDLLQPNAGTGDRHFLRHPPERCISLFRQGEDEKALSVTLKRALESTVQLHTFPKSVVEVYCMVLESDGGFAFSVCYLRLKCDFPR